jgi:predicted AAA+ superfamily ATPase
MAQSNIILPAWFERVRLHPDVESGSFSRATFAIDFGAVVANNPNIPIVYRDPRYFWQATYLTGELNRLLEEVLNCLSGKPGDRVLQMRSPFGGGKSHVLTALYHAAGARQALEQAIPEAKNLPDPGEVRVAGIDGEKFGPREGTKFNGIKVNTLWGALAAQIGAFDLVKEHEETRTAPGGDLVHDILGDSPTLILMDEVLSYVEKALTVSAGDSNLGRQTLNFLQTLTTEVAGSSHAVMCISLQC